LGGGERKKGKTTQSGVTSRERRIPPTIASTFLLKRGEGGSNVANLSQERKGRRKAPDVERKGETRLKRGQNHPSKKVHLPPAIYS